MLVRVQATTRLLAVAGDPVSHSLSPVMHNAAIAALGLDAVYVAARTTPRAFPGLVYSLLEAGGALNVTTPFKQQAAALVDRPSDAVQRTGACNTIWGDAENSSGDNTDIDGLKTAVKRLLSERRPGSVALLGTGPSARAAAIAMTDEFPNAELWIVSRTADNAASFVDWAKGAGVQVKPAPKGTSTDLAINCTPRIDALPGDIVPHAFLDLNYRPGHTPVVRRFQQEGIPASDGRDMLIGQGVVAFERFFGVQPPVDVMRNAVEVALRA